MPKADRQHTQVPPSARQRTRGVNTHKPESEDTNWNTHDPFTRATGAALRRLKRKQKIAEHVEEAPW